jgi:hypothetical protein
MLRAALLRILALVAVVVLGTSAISAALGALAGKGIHHSIAIGFYVVGAAVLVGSFVLGMRGPLRAEWSEDGEADDVPGPRRGILPHKIRRTTPDERTDAKRSSLALSAFGIALLLIGVFADPSRHAF